MDTVRASRDGHEFHEAWAARKALQLVMPADGLVGIAVEGLSPVDQVDASDETVEIADLTLYYGADATFTEAQSVTILQLKYSKSAEDVPFRMSHAKKTVKKFADAFRDHVKRFGAVPVREKLSFELVTNRPIAPPFLDAIDRLAHGLTCAGEGLEQAKQLMEASGLSGSDLREFAAKLRVCGLAGSLDKTKQELSRVVVDWSAAGDALARARLGQIRALLRDKAGLAGEGNNLITQIDVFAALDVQGQEDLFPCPTSFPETGRVVLREQLPSILERIPKLTRPLLIHAEGGSGKTVFLQSLAKMLANSNKAILFDCFGGGDYRAPEDGRHLPRRGLVHIVNNLAFEGLCDPLLPNQVHPDDLVRTFRARLAQAVATLRRAAPDEQIVLLIDAIDNAAEHAASKGEDSFPRLLLESIDQRGPIDGVKVVVACRTYRRKLSRGDIPCEEIELRPFSFAEAKEYLQARVAALTDMEAHVAYSRSEGNPRILEHLALTDRGLLDSSELDHVISLDELLEERVRHALRDARKRGYSDGQIKAFLAGLSVLPPPIPLEEYADAHNLEITAVRSFAADLAPLLEKTRHGLMFRDEPTESFIRDQYTADEAALRLLATNLFKKQGESVYAAAALPALLQELGDGELLFELAFDLRFPSAITSTVGKQYVRYSRLKAAVFHFTQRLDFNRLVHLMLELSTLAAVNQRGSEYILANPDLVAASQDVDATRRLFEMRTRWPGTRHARLAIANVFAGDFSAAYRHVSSAEEWTMHFFAQDEEYRRDRSGPERLDSAALPFYLVAQGQLDDAAKQMHRWKTWYAFEVSEVLFGLLLQAEAMGVIPSGRIGDFLLAAKDQVGVSVAAICVLNLDAEQSQVLLCELAKRCEAKPKIEAPHSHHREQQRDIEDGLLCASAIAISLGMFEQAEVISSRIPLAVPSAWTFNHQYSSGDALSFVLRIAVRTAAARQPLTESMVLPKELVEIGRTIDAGTTGQAYRRAIKGQLDKLYEAERGKKDKDRSLTSEAKQNLETFIDDRLDSILLLSRDLIELLQSETGAADAKFLILVHKWSVFNEKAEHHSDYRGKNRALEKWGRKMLLLSLAARRDLTAATIGHFLQTLDDSKRISLSQTLDVIRHLAVRPGFEALAGHSAIRANLLIEREDDVAHRADMFSQLGRAILPASPDEAAAYFRSGIDQLDAIGSGDYQFTNELLSFAASLRGPELEEPVFHTLSNLCELNMYEAEKFDWYLYGRALAKASGAKSLARLSRWHDRDKISLDYSLLPYLVALVDQDKLDSVVAVSLLRISEPAELYVCGTDTLAEVIASKGHSNSKQLLAELITQFERDHPHSLMHSSLEGLYNVAEKALGGESEPALRLRLAAKLHKKLNEEGNENRNYRGEHDIALTQVDPEQDDRRAKLDDAVAVIVEQCVPHDEASLAQALDRLTILGNVWELRRRFFDSVRFKVGFRDRPKYIHSVAAQEDLELHLKLREFKECRTNWASSSIGLVPVFKEIAIPLVRRHAEDLIHHDYLSWSTLKELEQLTNTPIHILVLELVALFSTPDAKLPASIWVALAATICHQSDAGQGQAAIRRLLSSGSSKLAAAAVDGEYVDGTYPSGDQTAIAAGLIWMSLGSPSAAARWRAAHSLRSLARFGQWNVIDAVVARFHSEDASPYQAPELPFYSLHAKMWLLIAIARTAKDHPQETARYVNTLKAVALNKSFPHVLIRHFAAQGIIACVERGAVKMSQKDLRALMRVNLSSRRKKRTDRYAADGFYQGRPKEMPEPTNDFHLDYDFEKVDVSGLANLFDRSHWQTRDLLSSYAHQLDPTVNSMYGGGRYGSNRRGRFEGMKSASHTYGQYIACHAFYLAAGELLANYPVVIRPYDSLDPWGEWIKGETLTRDDGLWLSDGVDRAPHDAAINLLEKGERRLVITGDERKVLSLLKIDLKIGAELVVAGDWRSLDGIGIHISSALAPAATAFGLAEKLAKEDAFQAWLPVAQTYDNGEESSRSERPPFRPWLTSLDVQARLDERDPLGANTAMTRTRLSKRICERAKLQPCDPFGRTWENPANATVARSEAWGRNSYDEDVSSSGDERLVVCSEFLAELLSKEESELIVWIRLRRYEKGGADRKSEFWHTTGVVRINSALGFEFYPGEINKLHVSRF